MLSTVVLICAVALLVWGLVDISDMISSGPSYDIYEDTTIPFYNDYAYEYYPRRQTYFHDSDYISPYDYGVFSWLPRWAYEYYYERYHHFRDDAESHTTLASILWQNNQTTLLSKRNSPVFVIDLLDSICYALWFAR